MVKFVKLARSFLLAFHIIAWLTLSCDSCFADNEIVLNNSRMLQYLSIEDGIQTIHLPKGIYKVPETLFLPSKVIFEGEGPGTVLRASSPFSGQRFITNDNSPSGSCNITVRSMSIEYNIPDYKGDSPGILRFENVDGLNLLYLNMDVNSAYYGIDLASQVHNCTIQGGAISNRGNGGGVMVRNRNHAFPSKTLVNDNPKINRCSLGENGQAGDEMKNDLIAPPFHATANISIVENMLTSVRDEPLAVFGWLGEVQNVLVSKNNVVADGASFGISVFAIDQSGHGGKISQVKVSDNTVRGGQFGGITVKGGATNVEVSRNSIKQTIGDGIFLHSGGKNLPEVSNIVVRQNEITNSGRHCIFASGANIDIDTNILSQCRKSGIYIGGQVNAMNNKITNAHPGILVDTNKNIVVRKNLLIKSMGINVLGAHRPGIEDNIINK